MFGSGLLRRQSWSTILASTCLAFVLLCAATCLDAEDAAPIVGRQLFTREWIPTNGPGGDGLGPLFNDTSCMTCHNQGGVGGAGSAAKNVQLVTAFSNGISPAGGLAGQSQPTLFTFLITVFGGGRATPAMPIRNDVDADPAEVQAQRERLAIVHPGFRSARSLVLHRFSVESDYAAFRRKFSTDFSDGMSMASLGFGEADASAKALHNALTREQLADLNRLKAESAFGNLAFFGGPISRDGFTFVVSERNAMPLFGSGRIDAIPDEILIAAAAKRFDDFPDVTGRVAKLKDGRLGRFGWKAQTARLNEFVLTACAVELGLHVPGEAQSGLPHRPEYQPPGLDLSEAQCQALISFVAGLPAPVQRKSADQSESEYLAAGRKLFRAVGCATCHTPELDDVAGIYSDLLLHDLGPELSDAGSYGSFAPNSTDEQELKQPLPALATLGRAPANSIDETKLIGATRQEWRTPPLWGLRDSAPYLHDGRAATIEQAIAFHGGEASLSVQKTFQLTPEERLQLVTFLRSLVAPH